MAAQWSRYTTISTLCLPNFVTHVELRAINATKFCRFAVPKNDNETLLSNTQRPAKRGNRSQPNCCCRANIGDGCLVVVRTNFRFTADLRAVDQTSEAA